MFSLVWPFPPDTNKHLNMAPLSHSYGALMVWIYSLIWFVAQDAVKMGAYYLIRKYQSEDEFEQRLRATKARIAAAIASNQRLERIGAYRCLRHCSNSCLWVCVLRSSCVLGGGSGRCAEM